VKKPKLKADKMKSLITTNKESKEMGVENQKILHWIDEHREEVVSFLQELIQIPSVNPWFNPKAEESREAEVQGVIGKRMEGMGAEVTKWEPSAKELAKYAGRPGYYSDHKFEGRPNQAAVLKGTGGGKSLLLTGHVDVVPAAGGWTVEPFKGERLNGSVYGRGAVDMKGGIAAMVMALEAVVKSGYRLKGDVIVGTVVDEEAGGMGTLDFVDKGYRADACILTESTDMKIAPLCRGILWGKLVIPGRSGHIELPQGDWREGGAVDAIGLARVFMDHFDRLNADWRVRKVHPYLPLPCQVYIAQINAGEYPTAFANQAEIVFNAQYLPREKDEKGLGSRVKGEIEAFVASVAQTEEWLRENPPKIEWLIDADCGETPVGNPFVQVIDNSIKQIKDKAIIEGIGFHTDMGWFSNVGIPTVNFGPGTPRVAHQNDESIKEQDLIDAAKTIALTIINWCEFSN
jgi:acetylornithine deacetylase